MPSIDGDKPLPLRLSRADEDSLEVVAKHLEKLLGSNKLSKTAVIKVGLRVTKDYFEENSSAWEIAAFVSLIAAQNRRLPDPRLMSFRLSTEYRQLIDWIGNYVTDRAVEEVPRLLEYVHSPMGDVHIFRSVCGVLHPSSKRYAGAERLARFGKIVQQELKGTRGQF